MSSKKDKIHRMQQQEESQVPTVVYNYRIDIEMPVHGTKTTYIAVTGVPSDLPPEYEETVRKSAEAQFASVLNQRLYLEFYSEGKTSKDEQPVFYNLSNLDWVKIKSIEKIN